jgi:uncharacterized ion transporter superfamily protein YfcC
MSEEETDMITGFQKFEISEPVNKINDDNSTQGKEPTSQTKKKCHFPTAYTILTIIEILVFFLTYIIPKGKYDTIEYSSKNFIIKFHNGTDLTINATEQVLKDFKIKIPIENFQKGYIKKPISIPGTYNRITGESTNFFSLFLYPIKGLIDSSDISFFLMILGGNLNILIESNALSSGMAALSRVTKGKGFLLACLVFFIISLGATTFGMLEEIFPFYPILMPIFLKSGLDGMLAAAPLYMGSMIGNMFSTVNAFTVVLGSYSAGINFIEGVVFRIITLILGEAITILYLYLYYKRIRLDEKRSVCYKIKNRLENEFLKNENDQKTNEKGEGDEESLLIKSTKENKKEEFTCIQKISIIIFICGFILMIIGVMILDWWFEHMSAVFIVFGVVLMFLFGQGEQKAIEAFIKGAGDFAGVAIINGIARGINITLDEGKILDTIINSLSNAISGFPKIIFGILMLIVFIFLGIFIQSSTGLAVLSMPIFGPLADEVSCSRAVVVNAYMYGQFLIAFISPTGYILIILQLAKIGFNYWIKFILPFMIIMFVILIILITISTYVLK